MSTRFHGFVGLRQDPVETSPGIFPMTIAETEVSGSVENMSVGYQSGELSQESVRAKHRIRVMGSSELFDNAQRAVYILWNGTKWIVSSVEYQHPEVLFTLGGLYNG